MENYLEKAIAGALTSISALVDKTDAKLLNLKIINLVLSFRLVIRIVPVLPINSVNTFVTSVFASVIFDTNKKALSF